jgi:hypothetical protein
MRKKAPASTNRPLRKMRVLVGRARHQASALSSELKKFGARVLEIPFIEIRQPRSYQPLDSALKNLADYDWLILTSVNGVEAMWARMDKLKLTGKRLHHARRHRPGNQESDRAARRESRCRSQRVRR